MCVVCGCGDTAARAAAGDVPAVNAAGDLHFGAGAARVSVPGMSAARAIKLEADVLGENDRIAAQNRAHFAAHGVTAYNLVSSPGSGKTTLLVATIEALRRRAPSLPVAVIEGDQQTSNDADRIRATGAPAIQVNTGKGCHLDAPMVAAAFSRLSVHRHAEGHGHEHGHGHDQAHDHEHAHEGAHADDPNHGNEHARAHANGHAHVKQAHGHDHGHDHEHEHDHAHEHEHKPSHPADIHAHPPHADHAADGDSLLFIENVGNLVCPAMWDLGERAKIAILSVTEGEDKPLKYPDLFAASRLMVLNKIDLLPHVDFDVPACIDYALRVNPRIEVLLVSAKTGQGMDAWLDWLLQGDTDAASASAASVSTPASPASASASSASASPASTPTAQTFAGEPEVQAT